MKPENYERVTVLMASRGKLLNYIGNLQKIENNIGGTDLLELKIFNDGDYIFSTGDLPTSHTFPRDFVDKTFLGIRDALQYILKSIEDELETL